jgi:peptidoglycan/xylan/chitin deacetylase (PgdA/CDA1 family)
MLERFPPRRTSGASKLPRRLLGALLGLSLGSPAAIAATHARPKDALGVSRTIVLGTKGGFAIGLKTYPQTLDLADHEVVLTFDDGPSPATTPRVLDALAKQCVKATFFLIGRNAEAHPALVRREIAEGHTLGHHTFSHPARTLRLMPEAAAQADIDRGFMADDEAAYGETPEKAALGPKVPFFRFPGFADTPALDAWLAHRNIGIFGADLWASDWLNMTPDEELRLVMKRLDKAKRGILLLHDTRRSTALMLPKFLVALKQHGFHIVQIVPGDGAPPKFRPPQKAGIRRRRRFWRRCCRSWSMQGLPAGSAIRACPNCRNRGSSGLDQPALARFSSGGVASSASSLSASSSSITT